MSALLRVMRKAVIERRRVYLDYSCWLEEAETLTAFQAASTPYTADAPIIIDTVYADVNNKKLQVFISGGLANTGYTIAMTIETSAGQVRRDELGLRVVP